MNHNTKEPAHVRTESLSANATEPAAVTVNVNVNNLLAVSEWDFAVYLAHGSMPLQAYTCQFWTHIKESLTRPTL